MLCVDNLNFEEALVILRVCVQVLGGRGGFRQHSLKIAVVDFVNAASRTAIRMKHRIGLGVCNTSHS